MFRLKFEARIQAFWQPVKHHRQRGGAQHCADDHLSDRHTRTLAGQYYRWVAIGLTLCCMMQLGRSAQATALARQTAPETPSSPADDWIIGPPGNAHPNATLLLLFWRPESGPLRREIQRFFKDPPAGLAVIGVIQSPDSQLPNDRLSRLLKRQGIRFCVVADRQGRWQSTYGAPASPFLYLIGQSRRILARQPLTGSWEPFERQIRLALEAQH